MRETIKQIYASHGIEYDNNGHIFSKLLNEWIPEQLINGNHKIGKGVWQHSTTAGNKGVDADVVARVTMNSEALQAFTLEALRAVCGGTCCCNCPGCYAQVGCYTFFSTRVSLARRTLLIRLDMDFVERAIKAQIKARKIKYVRIHAAGDFFSEEHVQMWVRIARESPNTIFWTYTKTRFTSCAVFDALPNCNIVKSLVDGKVNYGKAGYIVALYKDLKARGKSVWICRCGFDGNQHCAGCHHCYSAEYVLFLEHSTDYRPSQDPDIVEYIKLMIQQDKEAMKAAA
jgi:hypothetical protein